MKISQSSAHKINEENRCSNIQPIVTDHASLPDEKYGREVEQNNQENEVQLM